MFSTRPKEGRTDPNNTGYNASLTRLRTLFSKNWYKNNPVEGKNRAGMEPAICNKWDEIPGGSACVRGQNCRYAHTPEELNSPFPIK